MGSTRPAGADARQGSQSVRRALDLLSLIAGRDSSGGLSVAEAADEAELAKPTIHRLLTELLHAGYVEQGPDRRYRLGPEAYVIGSAAENRHGLQHQAVEAVVRLAAASEDVAFVSVRRGNHFVCVRREEGRWPIRSHVLQVGDRWPIGLGAVGTAFLAAMDPEERSRVVAANEAEFARYPRMDAKTVLGLADTAMLRGGIAVNEGLVVDESWGIGLAVPGRDGRPVLVLSIATISSRMLPKRQEWLSEALRKEVANLVGINRIRPAAQLK